MDIMVVKKNTHVWHKTSVIFGEFPARSILPFFSLHVRKKKKVAEACEKFD